MPELVHHSILQSPAGQYTASRLAIFCLQELIEDWEIALHAATDDLLANNEGPDTQKHLKELPLKLRRTRALLDKELSRAEELEAQTSPVDYVDALRAYEAAYAAKAASSADGKLPPDDELQYDAVLFLLDSVKDDASDWNFVAGSREAQWLQAALRAESLRGKIEKQEKILDKLALSREKEEEPEKPARGKRKRLLDRDKDKERDDDKREKTVQATLSSLREQFGIANKKADILEERINLEDAAKLIDKDLIKLIRNPSPSAIIRKLLLMRLKEKVSSRKEEREERREERREAIKERISGGEEQVIVEGGSEGAVDGL